MRPGGCTSDPPRNGWRPRIGNYTAGLIRGLVDVGASVTALVSSRGEITLVESQIGRQVVSTWHPDVVREAPDAVRGDGDVPCTDRFRPDPPHH